MDTLAATLGGLTGVADVRYDRRWLSRLNASVRAVRAIGLTIVSLLALASALTVANVIRLAALARRDEIEIMQLVGAPIAYVRGPFVVEGILQGGAGALVAIVSLWVVFAAGRARYGQTAAETLGLPGCRSCRLSSGSWSSWAACSLAASAASWSRAGSGDRPSKKLRVTGAAAVDTVRPGVLDSICPYNMNHARSRMARVVSPDRVLNAPVSVPTDFYRAEFMRHRECLALQREYFSERAITDADRALARVLGELDELCAKDDADQLIGRLLRTFNAVTGLSGWSDPQQLH